jgi:signal transduction histidine kinase
MGENKFFDKILENISRLDEDRIKSTLESIENERRIFEKILDNLDEGLIVINLRQVFFLNQEAERILGLARARFPLKIDELDKFSTRPEIIQFIAVNLKNQDFQTELPESKKEKRFYCLEKLSAGGGFTLIKIKDITENKKLEFQLKSLESISALNTLAAGIAHEIKNPLTAIDLHTQILKKGIEKKMIDAPEEVQNYIRIIDEEQKRLAKIVSDFLLAARKRELKATFEDINEFLAEILEFFKPEINENSVELILELHPVPKTFIDKDYLRQAILNLLKNAIEAMNQKKLENETPLKILKITTFYDKSSDSAGISISDTGIGIEKGKMEKIFEPYFTTKNYGTGLGLTIVYKIIKEHEGEIKVESERGKGACFTIYLPLHKGMRLITKN